MKFVILDALLSGTFPSHIPTFINIPQTQTR